ncbi:MAG: InlB B-repeat-containing protein [Clostridia bacterium]|nr:InlB B-repeat-containing protein [Clostridia bacterium]
MPTYVQLHKTELEQKEQAVRADGSDGGKDAKCTDAIAYGEDTLAHYAAMDETFKTEGGDVSVVQTIIKNLAKEQIDLKKRALAGSYSKSAEKTISDNKGIAVDLIDSIVKDGKIEQPYTYYYNGSHRVETVSSIVKAFEDSYKKDETLQYKGKKSKTPKEKKSSVTSGKTNKSFEITITSYDAYGNVINDFDSDARLEIREGTVPSVTRNINVLLGRGDLANFIADGIGDKKQIAEKIANKHIHNYFTLTVYEGKDSGNEIVREEFTANYKVEIKFLKDDKIAAYKDKLNVINYYHTKITGFTAAENEGDDLIMFFTGDFTQFAVLSDINWTDIAKMALIGVAIAIAAILLIVLLVVLIKNRKFTIVFHANGGRGNRYVRVKHNEKFSYPKNPVRNGYVFMGWYTTRKCETRFASTQLLERHRMVVYAKWITEEEYAELTAGGQVPEEEKDPKLDKLEAEKLAYEAKKAEEERKAEEIRLLTVQQIEESKQNEEARQKAEQEAEEAKAQLQSALADKEKAEKEAEELRKAAEANKAQTEIAGAAVVAAADEEEEEEPTDLAELFDKLKAEIYSYEKCDDLPYALEDELPACAMKIADGKILLELNLDLADMKQKGYNVSEGEKLPTLYAFDSEEGYDEAEELVEETMYSNSLKKTKKAVITEATEKTREEGFEYGISSERKATTAEEFFKLLRVYAKSFVMAEEGEFEEKPLIKMLTARGKVFLYLNYESAGLNACDEEVKAQGFKSFAVVRDAEECKAVMKDIAAMMKGYGLVRYPVDMKIADESDDKVFTYTLKK